ncbi:toprim domain-containing protein [Chryseobacterium gambrini]|uniref:Toprim domain-containing protein n=1 Tax=Chryseobacterium gambrini TaxID=373672 RepID=A0AAJ1VLW7_9FLAO|nr:MULTISPECIES: toprim domain-containing protein [Chryseobacterium]MDN4014581.1 toprim domain-containing protein [Chryseobacterium gambrini]MDN4028126.1 toprim domain-containing protein [Chryseobacterium gambrini]QWA39840.1 toprim domain-containing protein [Chryseobacterium sp. ZHDP1]
MNCKQFNSISLEEVLLSLGHLPTKQNEKEAWYLNPFASESQASFKINKSLNYWYLFSEGIGGNNTDFMKKYLNTSINGVLNWADSQNFSSFQNQNVPYQKFENLPKTYEIIEIKNVQHPALLEYLNERKVQSQAEYLNEIHYRMNDKNYFGIGFKNDSDVYEIRNKYSKICLGKKDISTIKNGSDSLRIFEGFFDFLSFKTIENQLAKGPSDYLILNSVSMIQNIKNSLGKYDKVELYFDNDEAGNRAVEIIRNETNNPEDCRVLYSDFKDLNEYLIKKTEEVQKQYKSVFKR